MSLAQTLAHPYVGLLSSSLQETPGEHTSPQGIGAWAAVAVVLRADDQLAELLFIKRVQRESDAWSGQVALPGGRKDPDDDTLLSTAIRETWEEVGLDLTASGRSLGDLDDVAPRTPVLPPIAVRPCVFAVTGSVTTSPGPEVAEVFWVPLDHLLDRSRWIETDVQAHGVTLRVQAISYGEHVIWGMTHRIVMQLAARLESD